MSDDNGADPGRWIYSGFPDKSVELPAQTLNAFLVGDALAVWAGDELIVWDGSSCVTDACDEFGVLTPFILRPQAPDAAAPQPVDPSGSWIVDEVEVDGEIAVDELSRGQTPALMIMNLEGAFEELDGVDTWIGSVVGFAGCEFSIALTHSPDGTSLGWGGWIGRRPRPVRPHRKDASNSPASRHSWHDGAFDRSQRHPNATHSHQSCWTRWLQRRSVYSFPRGLWTQSPCHRT